MEDMATTMPATRVVLAVLAGSPTVQARGATSVDIRLLPLNPLELEQFTAHVDWRTSTIESRETSPSPLYTQDARLILVVDDSPTNQLVARGQLETLGYEVAVASNGVDALAFCHRQAPDMVLMDIDMPVMGGLEAAERLRACQQTGTVPPFPIVAATAVDDALRRQQCLSVGMDGYLAKPMRLDALADEMHRVLPTRPVAAEQGARNRVARGP
jgi:CheY-like chemotaxis protein